MLTKCKNIFQLKAIEWPAWVCTLSSGRRLVIFYYLRWMETFKTCMLNKTRRLAIANGTYVSFCNQPIRHNLATSGESQRYVVLSPVLRVEAFSSESNAHFGLPGYAPGIITVNIIWMERGFNAGQKHSSICPSIVNGLRAIARYRSEIATFPYPLAFNSFVRGVPIGIPGKSWILRKL